MLQLALNSAWARLFFSLHRPREALFDIGLLWVVVPTTVMTFWRLESLAGALSVPRLL